MVKKVLLSCGLALAAFAVASAVPGDSIKVVKGQISDYYIPVSTNYDYSGRILDQQGNEEFPFSYTEEIGKKGRNGFLKMMKKHKNEILNSTEYLSFKEQFNIFKTYQMYFANLERVVNYIINRRH